MTARASKPFWQSTTLWINVLGIVALVISFVVETSLIPDADVVAILVAVLNIINRFRAPAQVKKLTIK